MRMQKFGIPRVPDPAELEEEQLLLLATLHSQVWALNVLIEKHRHWAASLIAKLGRNSQLQAADVEDAQQDAMLVLRAAILAYDCLRYRQSKACTLRPFLRLVLKAR